MLHKNFFKNLVFLFHIIAVTACNDKQSDEGLTGIDNFFVETEDLSNILNSNFSKDTMTKREERQVATYEERNAIAYILVKNKLVDLPQIRAEIKRNRNEIIIKNYFDKYVENAADDTTAQKYYDEHIDEFTHKRAHAAQILIKVRPGDDVNYQAELHKKVLDIADELRRGGSFEEAVKQHSEDMKSKSKAGDLGWLETGKANTDILENVMSLNVGEIPQPILTAEGYHIVKLLEPIEKNTVGFDEVKQKILYKIKYEEKLNELKRLKELAKNEVANLK